MKLARMHDDMQEEADRKLKLAANFVGRCRGLAGDLDVRVDARGPFVAEWSALSGGARVRVVCGQRVTAIRVITNQFAFGAHDAERLAQALVIAAKVAQEFEAVDCGGTRSDTLAAIQRDDL